MKTLISSLLRAICAIAVGALLVKYREQTVEWITVAIGILFFVSGVFSCVAYFVARGKKDDVEVYDANGKRLTPVKPIFPIVGLGSLILGLILAVMPTAFITYLVYLLAAILILGAVNQLVGLVAATRIARVGIYFWIMPSLTLLIGLVAVISPSSIASAPLFVIGWAMMVYGAVEMVNALKIYQLRRYVEHSLRAMAEQAVPRESGSGSEKEEREEKEEK